MLKNKKRQNFSIKKEVSDEFKKICDEKSINMSKIVEKFMVEYISKYKENPQL
jgi:hypothetical protein